MDESKLEKRSVLFTRPWELMGFGCHYAWVLFLVVNPAAFSAECIPGTGAPVRVALVGGIVVAYMAIFILCRIRRGFTPSRWLIVAGGIAGLVGTWLLLLPYEGLATAVLWCAACLMVGVSYALSMTAGNLFWTRNRPERAMLQLTTSGVFALAVYGVLLALPAATSPVVAGVLPLLGDAILALSKGGKQRPAALVEHPISGTDRGRMVAYAFAFMAVLGCVVSAGEAAVGFAAEKSFGASFSLGDASGHGSLIAGSLVIFLGIGAGQIVSCILAFRRNPSEWLLALDKLSTGAIVLGCAGVACFLFSSAGLTMLFQVVCLCGLAFSDHFFWILNAELAYRDRKDWAQAIVAAMGIAEWGGFLLGVAFVSWCPNAEMLRVVVFGIFCLYLLLRGAAFRAEDAKRLIYDREDADADDARELKSAAVARQFLLSPRETDVFMLLAQGRTGTYIQEQLTLSQSTVKTHMRNIYRKLNVSSKQELIDLVENTKV